MMTTMIIVIIIIITIIIIIVISFVHTSTTAKLHIKRMYFKIQNGIYSQVSVILQVKCPSIFSFPLPQYELFHTKLQFYVFSDSD